MNRAPWIIAGSIVLAALIVAVAIVSVNKQNGPSQPNGDAQAIVAGAQALAQDREAESVLRNALAAAMTYFTDGNTYSGWDPAVAAQIEPSPVWAVDTPASVGAVSINLATGNELVMTTLSASGQPFCIGDDAATMDGVAYGKVDAYSATSVSDCSGGW